MIHSVEIRQNIILLRRSQNITQEDAAFHSNTSVKWWQIMEGKYPNTSIDTMRRMAYALHVDPLVLGVLSLPDEEIISMAGSTLGISQQTTKKIQLGSNIVFLRRKRRLTQKQLAAASGISSAYLREIEHDCANVTLARLERIASALGVSLFQLSTLTLSADDLLDRVHAARVLAGMVVA